MNVRDIAGHWVALHEALGIGSPIADEAQYERALAFVEQVFDDVARDPKHPLGGLVDNAGLGLKLAAADTSLGLQPANLGDGLVFIGGNPQHTIATASSRLTRPAVTAPEWQRTNSSYPSMLLRSTATL